MVGGEELCRIAVDGGDLSFGSDGGTADAMSGAGDTNRLTAYDRYQQWLAWVAYAVGTCHEHLLFTFRVARVLDAHGADALAELRSVVDLEFERGSGMSLHSLLQFAVERLREYACQPCDAYLAFRVGVVRLVEYGHTVFRQREGQAGVGIRDQDILTVGCKLRRVERVTDVHSRIYLLCGSFSGICRRLGDSVPAASSRSCFISFSQ